MKIYNLEPLGFWAVYSLYCMNYSTTSTVIPIKGEINFLRDKDYERPYCQLIEDAYEGV